jgi:polar amino acid transport system permease protein
VSAPHTDLMSTGAGDPSPAPGRAGHPPLTRRQAYERRQRRASIVIATVSTAVVIGLLIVLIPQTAGWERVKDSFFNGEVLGDSLPRLLHAFWLDVKIFLWSVPFIFMLAMALALSRNVRNPVLFPMRLFAAIYTDVFRGVPVILTIYLIGFGVPGLRIDWLPNTPLFWGTVALILAYSAYVSEVFRAGIESVHESQRAAARSLGLSSSQTMRSVVLPQALRRVVPPLMNDLVSLQKDVALVSLIGPIEMLRQAGIDQANTFSFTPYVGAALIFLCVTIPLTRLTDWLMHRERQRMAGSTVS